VPLVAALARTPLDTSAPKLLESESSFKELPAVEKCFGSGRILRPGRILGLDRILKSPPHRAVRRAGERKEGSPFSGTSTVASETRANSSRIPPEFPGFSGARQGLGEVVKCGVSASVSQSVVRRARVVSQSDDAAAFARRTSYNAQAGRHERLVGHEPERIAGRRKHCLGSSQRFSIAGHRR
jgi:hypothetical protein